MRRLLYWLLKPLIWFLEWLYYLSEVKKEYGFKGVLHSIWSNMKDSVDNFFYEHHHNGIFGPGGHGWKTFKSGNLALLIAILTAIGFILYIIIN